MAKVVNQKPFSNPCHVFSKYQSKAFLFQPQDSRKRPKASPTRKMFAESRSTWPPGQAGTWNASRLSLRLTSFLAWTERTVRWQETTFLPFTRTLENRQTFKQCLFSIIELYISWKSVVVRMALMPITGRRRRLSQKR